MKKGLVYLFIFTLLFSSVVYAEKYSFEKFGISEIEIPAPYYLLTETEATNSFFSNTFYNMIKDLETNVPIVFVNDEDMSSIFIEPGENFNNTIPGFAFDYFTEREISELEEQLTDIPKIDITNLQMVEIAGHKFLNYWQSDYYPTLSYSFSLNGIGLSFRIINLFSEVTDNQDKVLQDVIESATFIIAKEKSGVEKFFTSIINFIKSYVGQEISNNLIWILIGVAALVIWGLFALIVKIIKPRR